jgi:hypothetical protein
MSEVAGELLEGIGTGQEAGRSNRSGKAFDYFQNKYIMKM